MVSRDRDLDENLIHYRCTAVDHVGSPVSRSGLTIHDGGWAYCSAGNVISEHRWVSTGGVAVADVRSHQAEYDSALVEALSAAEAMFVELRRAIGVTCFRLELARPGTPLTIDLGEHWDLRGRALCEVDLIDGTGPVGRLRVGDESRDAYQHGEVRQAADIATSHLVALRRWLNAHAMQ